MQCEKDTHIGVINNIYLNTPAKDEKKFRISFYLIRKKKKKHRDLYNTIIWMEARVTLGSYIKMCCNYTQYKVVCPTYLFFQGDTYIYTHIMCKSDAKSVIAD